MKKYRKHPAAAGCLFMANDTGRFCFGLRSRDVSVPSTWGTWGGSLHHEENPIEGARREAREETGYNGKLNLVPLLLLEENDFKYYNFLAIVPKEFKPELNWEHDSSVWADYGYWPQPLHPGVKRLLTDRPSIETIKMYRNLSDSQRSR